VLVCEACGNDMRRSGYVDGVDFPHGGKASFRHLECCSADELRLWLRMRAQRELGLYEDVMNVATVGTTETIALFEEKWGSYDEVASSSRQDDYLALTAVIRELGRRLAGHPARRVNR
jgi:hypothetical protein